MMRRIMEIREMQRRAEDDGRSLVDLAPDDVKRDNPKIADVIAGGSPANPMGVAAMTRPRASRIGNITRSRKRS